MKLAENLYQIDSEFKKLKKLNANEGKNSIKITIWFRVRKIKNRTLH